mmetsp:Transcript_13389/g.19922  ORF Transcript_13389/g.19922 Transcript_13389/m.19922 type:complete len:187 (-) Transcript_13389:236-796(-)|eukprot:CAMPEP_0116011168 /NCGR_PEP_ID=MMETSP0321-20121206/4415_1 /TAXON_ID=163516 /ORGANISM="Leptocylindrus danicus var. danicus, Strain B650" /LENGTH=186 /DNA_ID=CAMNT_0003480365 /DNA_START=349 /DNA_END=909 /DNA_ORIENTATION=+
MKVSLFAELSSDNFIAGINGNLDGFKEAHKVLPEGETCGFKDFVASVDAVVMGRKTFDVVSKMKSWWYGDTPVYVLSRDPNRVKISPHLKGNVSTLCGTPKEVLAILEANGKRNIYLDGGAEVIEEFMNEDLVDEATVTILPVAFGDGLSFLTRDHWKRLKEVGSKTYDFGFVQKSFTVQNASRTA